MEKVLLPYLRFFRGFVTELNLGKVLFKDGSTLLICISMLIRLPDQPLQLTRVILETNLTSIWPTSTRSAAKILDQKIAT